MCRKGKENLLYNALRLEFLGEVVLNLHTDARNFTVISFLYCLYFIFAP